MKKLIILPLILVVLFSGCTKPAGHICYDKVPNDYLYIEVVEIVAIVEDRTHIEDMHAEYDWYIETNSTLYPIVDLDRKDVLEFSVGDILEITWVDSCNNYPIIKTIKRI